MNAIIIAAGKGTRLRPLTNTTPKPLIEIFGKSMVERNIEYLLETGINDITIVVGYLKENFEFLKEKYPTIKIITNDKYNEYNNIYSLYLAKDLLKDTYILEGDIFLTKNIFKNNITKSNYFSKKPDVENNEWQLIINNNRINNIEIGGKGNYIMSGISFWTEEESKKIKDFLEKYIQDEQILKDYYWDHIIKENIEDFEVGIIPLKNEDIIEIDTLQELIEIDSSYKYILSNTKVDTAVILAAGKSREYDVPNGLIELDGHILIERSIELLLKYGIKKIVLVTGFQNIKFEYLKNKYSNIIIVENREYLTTGSFNSFLKARNYIDGNILLLDSDIVYEERALKSILKNDSDNVILVSSEKGQKDETFVECTGNRLIKISKDIRELKNIQGEMLGIAKLSKEFLQALFQLEVKNPMYAYEYAISECAKDYEIEVLKIDNLAWGEIDSIVHYNYVHTYLFPRIMKIELDSCSNELKDLLNKKLHILEEDIQDIEPLGGMTNRNYLVTYNNEKYVVRNPGLGTQQIIDRANEATNAKLMSDMRIDSDLIYYDSITGFKVSKFINEAQTLNPVTVNYYLKDVANILNTLHHSGIKFNNYFNCFDEINNYEEICKKMNLTFYIGYEEVKKDIMKLRDKLDNLGIKYCCCHNDTVPENFVRNEERIYLVDWEYSGMNDPMWDLAALSIESNLSEKNEEVLFKYYFKGNFDKESRLKIEIYKICQDFLWSIWTLIKEATGSKFGDYGITRFTRAKNKLKDLYKYE